MESAPKKSKGSSAVAIPAGQTSAAFDVTILDENAVEGTQTVTITASASGSTLGNDSIEVRDNEPPDDCPDCSEDNQVVKLINDYT